MTDKITVYSMPMCQPCRMTKRWLDERNIDYEDTDGREHLDYLRGLGAKSSPVVVYGDTVIVGFQPVKLKEVFGG